MLNTFKKRCMLVVSSQQFNATGGVGSSTMAIARMLRFDMGYAVDIVMDKPPNKAHKHYVEKMATMCGIYYPTNVLSYNTHNNIFSFNDSIPWEQMVNFRNSIICALKGKIYDLCVIQTADAIAPIFHLELYRYMNVVYYTHEYSSILDTVGNKDSVYNSAYRPWHKTLMTLPNVVIGSQSEHNVKELKTKGINAVCLPLPITEPELFKPNLSVKKEGVLFIGRWEDRKDPKNYVEMIKRTGLPARVMTSIKSKDKFIKAFNENNITDYIVEANLQGQAKVNFIQQCKVCYMPSKEESYGLVVYEAVASMPVITLDCYTWNLHHTWSQHYRINKKDLDKTILDLYNKEQTPNSLDECIKHEQSITALWNNINNYDTCIKAKQNKNSFNEAQMAGWVYDYLNKIEGRDWSIEDWQNISSSRETYKFTHTKYHTWYALNTTGFTPTNEPEIKDRSKAITKTNEFNNIFDIEELNYTENDNEID